MVMVAGLGLPKGLGFAMPGEWAGHCACWMAFPCRVEPWGGARGLELARAAYTEVARAIAEFEPVKMVVNPADEKAAAKMLGDVAEVIALPIDDSWMRDSGSTFVRDGDGFVAGINWRFNAWGQKYKPFDKDDALAGNILHRLGMHCFDAPLVMEGGSFHTDGEGTILTTEQCLLNKNRNPDLSRADIEKHLCDYLGGEVVVWLAGDERDTETDGHIDNIACFARPGEILAADINNDDNKITSTMRAENKKRLQTLTDAKGRKLQTRFLPSPSVRVCGEDLLASYINYYPANGGIVMPSFGIKEDDAARAIIAETFPDRRVKQVAANAIIQGGGGIHCITQQQPSGDTFLPQPKL